MSDIASQVANQSNAEKAIRKDLIEGTVDGWNRFLRERIGDKDELQRLMKNAWNEAVSLGATMPFEMLVSIHVSRDDTAKMAYRMATESESCAAMLLGKKHKAN